MQIQIKSEHLKLLKTVLQQYPYKFYVFGSRAKFKGKSFSDLDLVYKSHISDSILFKLQEELMDIPIPFRIDLVNWNTCSDDFKKLIKEDLVPFDAL